MDEEKLFLDRERLEKLLNSSERYGIFGVLTTDKDMTIIGFGKITLSQKAHILLSLRKLADKMENALFEDFNDNSIP